jgi:hypothetical protein
MMTTRLRPWTRFRIRFNFAPSLTKKIIKISPDNKIEPDDDEGFADLHAPEEGYYEGLGLDDKDSEFWV